jgi:hypothetical protein
MRTTKHNWVYATAVSMAVFAAFSSNVNVVVPLGITACVLGILWGLLNR